MSKILFKRKYVELVFAFYNLFVICLACASEIFGKSYQDEVLERVSLSEKLLNDLELSLPKLSYECITEDASSPLQEVENSLFPRDADRPLHTFAELNGSNHSPKRSIGSLNKNVSSDHSFHTSSKLEDNLFSLIDKGTGSDVMKFGKLGSKKNSFLKDKLTNGTHVHNQRVFCERCSKVLNSNENSSIKQNRRYSERYFKELKNLRDAGKSYKEPIKYQDLHYKDKLIRNQMDPPIIGSKMPDEAPTVKLRIKPVLLGYDETNIKFTTKKGAKDSKQDSSHSSEEMTSDSSETQPAKPSPKPSPQSSPKPSPQSSPKPSPQSSPKPSPQSSPKPSPQSSPKPSPIPSPQSSPKPSPPQSPLPSPPQSPPQSPPPSPPQSPPQSPPPPPSPPPQSPLPPPPPQSPLPPPPPSPPPSSSLQQSSIESETKTSEELEQKIPSDPSLKRTTYKTTLLRRNPGLTRFRRLSQLERKKSKLLDLGNIDELNSKSSSEGNKRATYKIFLSNSQSSQPTQSSTPQSSPLQSSSPQSSSPPPSSPVQLSGSPNLSTSVSSFGYYQTEDNPKGSKESLFGSVDLGAKDTLDGDFSSAITSNSKGSSSSFKTGQSRNPLSASRYISSLTLTQLRRRVDNDPLQKHSKTTSSTFNGSQSSVTPHSLKKELSIQNLSFPSHSESSEFSTKLGLSDQSSRRSQFILKTQSERRYRTSKKLFPNSKHSRTFRSTIEIKLGESFDKESQTNKAIEAAIQLKKERELEDIEKRRRLCELEKERRERSQAELRSMAVKEAEQKLKEKFLREKEERNREREKKWKEHVQSSCEKYQTHNKAPKWVSSIRRTGARPHTISFASYPEVMQQIIQNSNKFRSRIESVSRKTSVQERNPNKRVVRRVRITQ